VRKLEYVLGEALARGADTLITSAGLQSNRARMTATACRRTGLDCILLLCSNYGENAPIGNLMLDAIFAADVRFSAAPDSYSPEALAEAEAIADDLRARGRRAHVTEVGGRPEPQAEVGYFVGGLELAAQCRAQGFEPGAVLLPSGSGSTQAGVLVGLRSAGLSTPVIGVAVAGSASPRPAASAPWRPDWPSGSRSTPLSGRTTSSSRTVAPPRATAGPTPRVSTSCGWSRAPRGS
jgi:L-cysteate sulfo-lyase